MFFPNPYNTSSSLLSPFEVMFGRKAIIPIELSYHKAGSELLGECLTLSNDVSVTLASFCDTNV